ncbi:hypothetical protein [Rathayibacter sp. Leaf296]|uniref:hypothetical protein n=1 Tax=Rathayibacter sp. Leaf296 TaxID=1736327 RepID=UPI000703BC23|nr:hypothetical protein [Rathayibacter sp. Leaf296]KQQ07562.1 hypothetical protein ASF46_18155 [Rathayibacter sp. Leaf296]
MSRRLLGIGDLTSAEIDAVLDRARVHSAGESVSTVTGAVVGLAFFQTSLRTRIGFESAAHRLGARPVTVVDRRASEASLPESIGDTVRVLSGYSDAVVVRADRPAARTDASVRLGAPWLNGGDGGAAAEHPSQTLIDLFAVERLVGPVNELHVAITGDLRMRAARGLLRLLARRPPARLSVVSDGDLGLSDPVVLASGAAVVPSVRDLDSVDVLYAVGIPKGPGEAVRSRLRVDGRALETLTARGAVLSPLPIIDEIALSVRGDRRLRFFEQSDLGLFVRMALLEHVLSDPLLPTADGF